jgi:hypothetical protein
MHVLTPTAFALLVCVALISCGGGDLEASPAAPQSPSVVSLEGCVVDARDRPRVQAVQASTAEGRTVATAMSDAHGVFRMHVPAQEVIRIATMPDAGDGVTIMTGRDATILGGCLRH